MIWKRITCQEREDLIDRLGRSANGLADPYCVLSALTDLSGEFGEPKVFSEWGHRETDVPVLRDYRWPDSDRPCEHYAYAEEADR